MADEGKSKGKTADGYERAGEAWTALVAANDALLAVGETHSAEWVRTGMRVVKQRTKAFLHAIDSLLKENDE